MGLIADGLDMLADAAVYGVAILALGGSALRKVRAAYVAGYLQLTLFAAAVLKLVNSVRSGSDPDVLPMIGISLLALSANAAAIYLLRKHRHGDVHLRAAWIFSATDVQVNVAVIVAGILVSVTQSAIPDLVVGALICVLVLRSVIRILGDARDTQRKLREAPV
jgi:Co/Zn/Cd efflux system component